MDGGGTGAAVFWKDNVVNGKWREQKVTLGKNKEILDAEMWGIRSLKGCRTKDCNKSAPRYWYLLQFSNSHQQAEKYGRKCRSGTKSPDSP